MNINECMECFRLTYVTNKIFLPWQALTSQILCDVRSHTRVLHYLSVNVLPY